jgi:hypothetical protein
MKIGRVIPGVAAVALALASGAPAYGQGSSLGSVAATGAARVDGQAPGGAVGSTARLSTGSGGAITVALARGGELRLGAQTDIILTDAGDRLRVQLICGEVTAATPAPYTVYSRSGARVQPTGGAATVTSATLETVADGRTGDFKVPVSVSASAPGATLVVTSATRCDCDCTNNPTGRP